MKTILVPVEVHAQTESLLGTACRVAKSFDAVLEGLFLRPVFLQPLGVEPASAIVVSDTEQDDAGSRQEASASFQASVEAQGLSLAAHDSATGPSAVWNEEFVADDDFLGRYARAFDLTVIARPADRAGGPRMSTLEAVLFDSGRPILIVPPEEPAELGRRIAIVWNGSTETARALTAAKPFLQRGEEVNILVDQAERPGPSGRDVQTYLARNGIVSELHTLPSTNIRSGEAILEEANKLGSDLIVKGAYTQSRLRQLIFGSATGSIISKTNLPVLMAH